MVKLPSDIIVFLLPDKIVPFFRHMTGIDFVHGHDKTIRLSLPATAITLFSSNRVYGILFTAIDSAKWKSTKSLETEV